MSSFIRATKNPKSGEFEDAMWIDDLFGRHRYGVIFPSDSRAAELDKMEGKSRWGEIARSIAYDPDLVHLETVDVNKI